MVDHRSDRRRVQPAQEEMAEKAQLTGRVTALRSCDQPPGLSHPLSAEGTSDADRRDRPPDGTIGPLRRRACATHVRFRSARGPLMRRAFWAAGALAAIAGAVHAEVSPPAPASLSELEAWSRGCLQIPRDLWPVVDALHDDYIAQWRSSVEEAPDLHPTLATLESRDSEFIDALAALVGASPDCTQLVRLVRQHRVLRASLDPPRVRARVVDPLAVLGQPGPADVTRTINCLRTANEALRELLDLSVREVPGNGSRLAEDGRPLLAKERAALATILEVAAPAGSDSDAAAAARDLISLQLLGLEQDVTLTRAVAILRAVLPTDASVDATLRAWHKAEDERRRELRQRFLRAILDATPDEQQVSELAQAGGKAQPNFELLGPLLQNEQVQAAVSLLRSWDNASDVERHLEAMARPGSMQTLAHLLPRRGTRARLPLMSPSPALQPRTVEAGRELVSLLPPLEAEREGEVVALIATPAPTRPQPAPSAPHDPPTDIDVTEQALCRIIADRAAYVDAIAEEQRLREAILAAAPELVAAPRLRLWCGDRIASLCEPLLRFGSGPAGDVLPQPHLPWRWVLSGAELAPTEREALLVSMASASDSASRTLAEMVDLRLGTLAAPLLEELAALRPDGWSPESRPDLDWVRASIDGRVVRGDWMRAWDRMTSALAAQFEAAATARPGDFAASLASHWARASLPVLRMVVPGDHAREAGHLERSATRLRERSLAALARASLRLRLERGDGAGTSPAARRAQWWLNCVEEDASLLRARSARAAGSVELPR